MIEVDSGLVLSLITVAALAYFMASQMPRVDRMERSYRKFLALTTLGISYIVLWTLLLTILAESGTDSSVALALGIAVAAYVLFTLTLLWDVADDWLRLFADPAYNTWVEVSMVLAVGVLLYLVFLLSP